METNINANANIGTSLETEHTLDFSDRLYKVAMAFIAVVGVLGAGWVFSQFSALPQNAPHEIMVSGEGRAYIKPDIALVSFGVTSKALKSQDAVNDNNTKMNAVIKAIKDLGVKDEDIQTTMYNLYPVYDYPKVVMPSGGARGSTGVASAPVYFNGGQVFSGYSLEQQVAVKIRNFDIINSVLDKATAVGATNVGQLQFTVDNPELAQSQAREMAIAKAKEKLQSILKQSGLQVGKLVNISEGYGGYPGPMYATGAMAKDSVSSVAPQIQTGQQEVSSTVTLTYQVK